MEFGVRCKDDIGKHHGHFICYIIINYSTAVIIQMPQGIYSGKQGTFYNVIIRHWGDMTLFRVMGVGYGKLMLGQSNFNISVFWDSRIC